LIKHVHIATRDNRKPPGFEPCDFGAFFQALQEIGYDGRVSIESRWDDVAEQASKAYSHLAQLVADAGF
jgi:sugar phosphate isomerase/epimerase